VRAAVFYDVDDIRIEEIADPVCGPEDIVVETRACGICTGELMDWYMRQKAPFVFGHEPAGVVVEVGSSVKEWSVGDRVFVHHHAPCFACRHCRRGAYVQCDTWKSSRLEPGGMAERFRVAAVNQRDTLRLPENVSWEGGVLVEPLACAVQALSRARVQPGDTVLVIGLGFMGQLLAKAAWSFGAGRVIAADFVQARRAMAERLGVSVAVDPGAAPIAEQVRALNQGALADVVIVGPPVLRAIENGLSCAGNGGTVVLFSPTPPGETLAVPVNDIYFRDISIIPSYSCGPTDTRRALALISGGALVAEEFITHRYSFEQTADAYAAMRGGGDVLKAVIHF